MACGNPLNAKALKLIENSPESIPIQKAPNLEQQIDLINSQFDNEDEDYDNEEQNIPIGQALTLYFKGISRIADYLSKPIRYIGKYLHSQTVSPNEISYS